MESINILEEYSKNNNLHLRKFKENNTFFFNYNFKNELLKLLKYDYVIFLTDKYLTKLNYYLLSYLKKYNILYFNYFDKDVIINNLSILNDLIKSNDIKYKNRLISALDIKKLKFIHFPENVIEPNTLYKKISFSKEEQFLPFDIYGIKKMEYKLRTFCQIAEKLGAKNITIYQQTRTHSHTLKHFDVDAFNIVELGLEFRNNNILNSNIDFTFDYSNYFYNLNLNKYHLIQLIENENEFFITKEEFENDIDLKFLIDARCINLIKKYNTKIIIQKMNELEKKILTKAKKYGLYMSYEKNKNYTYFLNININFFNIYENFDCIDGYNIYNMKEGFYQLSNIIKKEIILNNNNKITYCKINNFLDSHIRSLKKLNYDKENNYLQKYDTIKLNFKKKEIAYLFCDIFNGNLHYHNFLAFRDYIISDLNIDYLNNQESIIKKYFKNLKYSFFENILNDQENLNDKLSFICSQNHMLLYCINQKLSLTKKKLENLGDIFGNDNSSVDSSISNFDINLINDNNYVTSNTHNMYTIKLEEIKQEKIHKKNILNNKDKLMESIKKEIHNYFDDYNSYKHFQKLILHSLIDYFKTNISLKEIDIILIYIINHINNCNDNKIIEFFNKYYKDILNIIYIDIYEEELPNEYLDIIDKWYYDGIIMYIFNLYFVSLLEIFFEINNKIEIFRILNNKYYNLNYNYNTYRIILCWDDYKKLIKEIYNAKLITKKEDQSYKNDHFIELNNIFDNNIIINQLEKIDKILI